MNKTHDKCPLQYEPYLLREFPQPWEAKDVQLTQLNVEFVLRDVLDDPSDEP